MANNTRMGWIAAGALLLIFALHALTPSNVNGYPPSWNFSWDRLVDTPHATEHLASRFRESEFNRRPVMIYPLAWLNRGAGIPVQLAFNLLSFLFLWLSCILLYRLTQRVSPQAKGRWGIAVGGFLTAFPVVFSFMATIWMYDDPPQYVFLLAALLSHLRGRYLAASLWLGLACLARETSILFLPLLVYWHHQETGLRASLWVWALAPALWLGAVVWLLPAHAWEQTIAYSHEVRFGHWHENFRDTQMVSETLSLIFITLALPYALVYRYLRAGGQFSVLQWRWLWGSLTLALINTPLVLVAALAREARLLILPLILLWPLLPTIEPWLLARLRVALRQRRYQLAILGYLLMGFALAFGLYYPSVRGTGYLFRVYAAVYTGGFLFFWRLLEREGSR